MLTYKTGHKLPSGDWHTTTRMVRLDPAQPQRTLPNPRDPDGGSVKITDSVHRYIEENPVFVKHGDQFTLFTSFGWYGTCDYWTRYRQNTSGGPDGLYVGVIEWNDGRPRVPFLLGGNS